MDLVLQGLCELIEEVKTLNKAIINNKGAVVNAADSGRGKNVNTYINPVARIPDRIMTLAEDNPARIALIIHNNSDNTLFIALDDERVSTTYYTYALQSQQTLHLDGRKAIEQYKKKILGIWCDDVTHDAVVIPRALVTEIFFEHE